MDRIKKQKMDSVDETKGIKLVDRKQEEYYGIQKGNDSLDFGHD